MVSSSEPKQHPEPRKEVMRFAEAMEDVLRRHDDKGGWENCGLAWLIERAQGELNEAKEKWDAKNFRGDYDGVATELIDVANFCMMFYDNLQNDGYHHNHPYPISIANTDVQSPEHYTGACAIQDKCMDYADFIESIMDEIDNEDDDVPCPIKCEKRVNPHGDNNAQARIDAVVAMLQRWKDCQMVDLTDGSWYSEVGVEKLDKAIALLKEGVGK